MKKIMMTLAAVLCCTMTMSVLTACTDNDDNPVVNASVNLPEDAEYEDGAMLVHQWASEFTLDIATDGEWRIESDRLSLYPEPSEGKGNAQVTVSVQPNTTDHRKVGHLTIIFPGHEEKNKTITVEQEWYGDEVENGADEMETSNKIYAVGFSYDCTGEYASPNSVKKEVFNTQELIKDGALAVNAVQVSLTNNTITGSSISEMTNHLTVKANVKGGFGKFKAEANASFDMNHVKNSNYEFASTYFDLEVRRASLNKSFETLKGSKKYMMEDARNDINGIPVTDDWGVPGVKYPSTQAGFKDLIKDYGTHVIVEAGLGGRVRYSMSVDISKIESTYDIKAFAKAGYAGIVTAEGSVDEKFKESFNKNKTNLNIKLSVLGGDAALATQLGSAEGFTKENLDAWVQSVTKNENMALVSFSEESLVPIYELVDRNATLEHGGFDGEARYQALKEYVENGCSNDFSSYDCGTVTEFDVPSFENAAYNSTLIKDIVIDGQYVGQVCNEYIPNIDREKRVTVVYPVVNNKPRYNMGMFLGNNSHKPARVSWDGTDAHIEEYVDLDFGKVSKLYLRGSSVRATPPEGTTPIPATAVKDEYLEGLRNTPGGYNIVSNYPLVKIFNKIWTREEYCSNAADNRGRQIEVVMDGKTVTIGREYYKKGNVLNANIFPEGWRVAALSDYTEMTNKLVANGYSLPALALLNGGVTGFNAYFVGFYRPDVEAWDNDFSSMYLVTSDGMFFRMFTNGIVDTGTNGYNFHCIRLVKE